MRFSHVHKGNLMGYDLHITRRRQWTDTGNDITAAEWLDYVARDAELNLSPEDGPYWAEWSGASELPHPWLDWENGNIYTKNPDAPFVRKMCAIARALHAGVQGDDGEFYSDDGKVLAAPAAPREPLIGRVVRMLRSALEPRSRSAPPPDFAVGDHILDVWGHSAVVAAIDLKANHGLGAVKLRYDNGRELTFALGSDFRKAERRT